MMYLFAYVPMALPCVTHGHVTDHAEIHDGQFNPEYRRLPMPAELFLWPSFLHHLVHPNLVDEPRVSISFNVVLKRKVL